MAGRTGGFDDEDGINEINVTPLVDVMLVLLVIFLVASVYIVKDAVELELPKAASATEAPETTISIVMDQRRALYLNGNPTDQARLAKACEEAAKKNANTQAIIAADHRVSHGDVIDIIDLVRTHGLERFALNVKRTKSGPTATP
jgi:biopolymer transport protein TolR